MIKVSFSPNEKTKTTESLYQWDFGQKLEIEAPDLPAAFEVHFSCNGMSEAVIVPCSGGAAKTVDIPDVCLEQSAPITAWVYVISGGGSQGYTQKTITIPVISRARPGRSQTVPPAMINEYTQLISEVNELISDLTEGRIIAKEAEHASRATRATDATNAGFANEAQKAYTSDFAELLNTEKNYTQYTAGSIIRGGLMLFRVSYSTYSASVVMEMYLHDAYSSIFSLGTKRGVLYVENVGDNEGFKIVVRDADSITTDITANCQIHYKYLSQGYALG